MPYVPLRDGQQLYVRTVGRGRPVLMLPGLGMVSRQWLPFVLPHARRFRFVMPDFRGHGRSLRTSLSRDDIFEQLADDVEDVIAHFELDDFALAGLSLGATTSLHLQRRNSLRGVHRYLHIDQSPNVLNDAEWSHGLAGTRQAALLENLRRADALLERHADVEFLDELPPRARRELATTVSEALLVLGTPGWSAGVARQAIAHFPGAMLRRAPLMRVRDLRAYLRGYSGGGYDYRPTLHLGDAEVTLMIGMNSPLYPAEGQLKVAEAKPGSRVVRFHRSGHVPLMDEPLRFAREFRRFLHATP